MSEKRVACLYRVSTLMQVEDDDIPMQKKACKEFIEKMPNWKLVKEYCEKGVSGYKKKAIDRDQLQAAKEDALKNEFDILLVFMFDRLGRREDETPFVVEWFVQQGIEVWSTKEGQQKFDNRVDKLLNYIRYWQAGGESEKTSIRVKEKQSQMVKDGILMYGTPPYGYEMVKSGIFSKKGVERKKLQILPKEAEVVREVYKLSTENGWGGHRIAKYLNEHNIPTKKNSKWTVSVVNFMLRNPIYKGYLSYNKTSVKKNGTQGRIGSKDWILSEEKIDEIVIIDEEEWNKAQKIRESRIPDRYKEENMDYESYPLQTRSKALLTGFIKCGYCGCNMNSSKSTDRSKLKTGEVKKGKERHYYRCVSRISNGGATCKTGKTCYKQEEIDNIVIDEVFTYLDTLKKVDLSDRINEINLKNKTDEEIKLKEVTKKLSKSQDEFETLKGEIVSAINGTSKFSTDILSNLLEQKETEINNLQLQVQELKEQIEKQKYDYNSMVELKNLIPIWREEFEKANTEIKKMLLSQIIESVLVFEDKIEIKLRITMKNFLKYAQEMTPNDSKYNQLVNPSKTGYIRL